MPTSFVILFAVLLVVTAAGAALILAQSPVAAVLIGVAGASALVVRL